MGKDNEPLLVSFTLSHFHTSVCTDSLFCLFIISNIIRVLLAFKLYTLHSTLPPSVMLSRFRHLSCSAGSRNARGVLGCFSRRVFPLPTSKVQIYCLPLLNTLYIQKRKNALFCIFFDISTGFVSLME